MTDHDGSHAEWQKVTFGWSLLRDSPVSLGCASLMSLFPAVRALWLALAGLFFPKFGICTVGLIHFSLARPVTQNSPSNRELRQVRIYRDGP